MTLKIESDSFHQVFCLTATGGGWSSILHCLAGPVEAPNKKSSFGCKIRQKAKLCSKFIQKSIWLFVLQHFAAIPHVEVLQLLRLKRSVAAQMYVCKVKFCTLGWNIKPKFAWMYWAYYVVRTILEWRCFQQNTRVTSSIFNLVWHSKTVRLDRWFHDWGKR